MKDSDFDQLQRVAQLTAREQDCLCRAAEGKAIPEIALSLNISENTVKYHFKNILKKLGAKNKVHATALAMSKGYIEPVLNYRGSWD